MNRLELFFKRISEIRTKPIAAINRHPINAVISRFGGRRDISYLKVLMAVEGTEWPMLIEQYFDARVCWGVVIGAGIGGPTSDPISSYLFGGYHAWPIFSEEEATIETHVAELIKTLQFGLNALLDQPYFSSETTLFKFLAQKHGDKWPARIHGLNRKANPENLAANAPVGESEDSLQRQVCLTSALIRESHFWVSDVTLYPDPLKVTIDNPAEVISSLLFAAWGIIGDSTDMYISGILSGIFPVLCMGPNTRTEKLIRLSSRIDREFELPHHISVTDGSALNLWYGCKDIIKVSDFARVAASKCHDLAIRLGSTWIDVFARRMKYFGLSAIVLTATAVSFFKHAAWSQFFDIDQRPYTADSLKLKDYPLIEWVPFVECVIDLTELGFTVSQFRAADDETKIKYLIEAFQAIRPRGSHSDWLAQGEVCLQQVEIAMVNPYVMYTGVPGRTSEMGDLAYYALMLLRDIGKQSSLENYKNTFHKYAKRPMEVEQLVNWYKKVMSSFPGGKGIIEMQDTELSRIVSYFTSEDNFGPQVEEQITRRMFTASKIMKDFAAPSDPKTPGPSKTKTRGSKAKDQPTAPKRPRNESGSSAEASSDEPPTIVSDVADH